MNDIIRKLAVQAGMQSCSLGYGSAEQVLWGESEIEKFAKLIIQECANTQEGQSEAEFILNHFGMRA